MDNTTQLGYLISPLFTCPPDQKDWLEHQLSSQNSRRSQLCNAIVVNVMIFTFHGGSAIDRRNTRNLWANIPNPFSDILILDKR